MKSIITTIDSDNNITKDFKDFLFLFLLFTEKLFHNIMIHTRCQQCIIRECIYMNNAYINSYPRSFNIRFDNNRYFYYRYYMDLVFVALRSIAVYLFIVIAIRIFGKREITQLSVIDLVFILLISNSVQNAMVGPDTTLLGGIVAATALFVVNTVLSMLLYKSKTLTHLLEGEDIMLIYQGKVLPKHLKEAGISIDELHQAVREHGVADIKAVDLAVLETDGNISILSENYHHKTIRKRKAHKALNKEV